MPGTRAEGGEVEVEVELRVNGDIGRVVNPRTPRSQLVGGMTFGLAQALMEASTIDPLRGHVVEPHFAGYHIPVNADIADVDVLLVDVPDPHISDLGARGAGEIGVVGSGAAIANAYFHATGIRARELPITPARFVAAGNTRQGA